ncbi:MAG TPA: ubiquinone/menaquinone biosynthesis methyltransferase [Terriglobia bacterium]|nr:ubiquinone/menaquinone biosynthesis methyltransferase [Terriglobia bacterium]
MFSGIAHRYDFLNHLLSASVDHRWRRLAAERVVNLAGKSNLRVLDLCSGTGDLAIELARIPDAQVLAADFCHPMLTRAAPKIAAAGFSGAIGILEADALALPLPDACCDAVTIAFGLRNLADRARGVSEMRRVLKPGGALVVLEFSRPVAPVFRQVFEFYFQHVLPRLGAWISGDGGAYTYLPDSVAKFPSQTDLAAALGALGFARVGYRNLFGGVAALHWGLKPKGERAAL